MALANILVQQSIANDGQPKAVLVDSQGKPLIRNTSEQNKPKTPTEEQNRETQYNIQKMVDLLEIIAKNVSVKDMKPVVEQKEESSSFLSGIAFGFGFYMRKYITKFFGLLMGGLGTLLKFTGRLLLRSILIGFASLLTLPLGVIAAIVFGFTGLVRGIKEAFQVYKDGGSFTDVLFAFMDGFTKEFLNFAFDAIDWVLSIFGIDLFPKNLGDKIVDAVKELFKSIVDYIKSIPSRLAGALKEALVPKGGSIDNLTRGYFNKEVPATPVDTNTDKVVSNKTFKMPEGDKTGITSDLSGVTAPITKVEPITSVIPKPISGSPSPSFKTKMTKEEAKAVVEGHPKLKQLQAAIDESQINGLTLSRKQVEDIVGNDDPKFRQAFEILYKNDLEKMYAANESADSAAKDRGVSPEQLRKMRQQQTINDIEASTKYSGSLTPGTPSDVGNQIMASSAEVEGSKIASTSSPIIVSAPSSTVNAPKESNLMTSKNVRNDENTLSKYVGSLYGSNI